MKKMKKIVLFSLLLGGAILMSKCQDETYLEDLSQEIVQKKESEKIKKSKKKIKYRGLIVSHRFESTEKELKEKHTKKYLKKLYNELRKKYKKKSNTSSKVIEEELPEPYILYEASKVVVDNFPYETSESYNENSDGVEINISMLQSDFNIYSESDLEENHEIIDEYYSKNLDYMVLDEIAKNSIKYDNLELNKENFSRVLSDEEKATCMITFSFFAGFGLVRSAIAISVAGKRARTESVSRYSNLGTNGADDRQDAYRHILWNSLLAQNYFTIWSKSFRIAFATYVSYLNENMCGGGNLEDAKEMDFHNNEIGRKIWLDNVRRGWFGVIKRPSNATLINSGFNAVENNSCFIVADRFIDDDLIHFSTMETKAEIEKIYIYTPVYIKGPILPKKWITKYERIEVACDPDNNIIIAYRTINTAKVPSDDGVKCYEIIPVQELVNACFKSKDPNYNPY